MFKNINVFYEQLSVIEKPIKMHYPKRNNDMSEIQWDSTFFPLLKFRSIQELEKKLQKHIGNGTITWGNYFFFSFFPKMRMFLDAKT